MKELADGTQVPARMYYYLLDFNEMTNWDYIRNVLRCGMLKELNRAEFFQLFTFATNADMQNYKFAQ